MKNISRYILIILVIFGASLISWTPAGSLEGTEYQIKAAMMMNFFQFVEWPDNPNQPKEMMILGVIGADKFGDTLSYVQGRIVNGKMLTLKRFDSIKGLNQCHMLFVPASESDRINEILKSINGSPVLTVGETDSFTQQGGIIRFYLEKNHVRFEINKTAAMHSKLKISAKLMEIGRVID